MGFQSVVNQYQSPAVEGGFASTNPRATTLGAAGAYRAASAGVTVARFAWVEANGYSAANTGQGAPDGFVANELQGSIEPITAESGMNVLAGQPVTLYARGDFWVRTLTAAVRKMKIFASYLTGQIATAAAGSTISAFSGTASFATSVMTVTAVTSGAVAVGQRVISAGVAAETYVASFGTGTGGAGTYNLTTTPGTIAAQAVTTTEYVETGYMSADSVDAGELIKMTHWS